MWEKLLTILLWVKPSSSLVNINILRKKVAAILKRSEKAAKKLHTAWAIYGLVIEAEKNLSVKGIYSGVGAAFLLLALSFLIIVFYNTDGSSIS